MTVCRFPGCEAVTGGRDAVFCADHHFACTRVEAGLLIRTSIAARRTESTETREYLRSQLDGYVSVIVKKITKRQEQGQDSVA